MDSIQTAFELYYNDAGAYPDVNGWTKGCAESSDNDSDWSTFVSDLNPYMQGSVPTPPGKGHAGNTNCYWYRIGAVTAGNDSGCDIDGGPQSYLLLFYSENTDFNLPIYEENRNGNEGDLYCVTSS